MRSIELLPALERIPLSTEHGRYSWTDVVERSAKMRNDLFAIEVGAAAEVALSGLFDARNVPDDLFEAYRRASPSVAAGRSLYKGYKEMVDRGPRAVTGFINNLKGKLAEVQMPEHLKQEFPGYSFKIASSQNQPVWDIKATSPDGAHDVLISVKVGTADYAAHVYGQVQEHPDVVYAASNEIRAAVLAGHPELASHFVNLDLSNHDFTSGVEHNMNVLADNFGIHVPDKVGGFLPYVKEVVLGIRLLCDIVRTERDFKRVAIDDRGRIHAMKALVLFQRFGVSAVCTTAGGALGTHIVPGFGTAGGAIGGAVLAAYLNSKLRSHTMEIAMWLMRVTDEDMFYFRNKVAIDRTGSSLAETALSLLDGRRTGALA